MFEITPNGLLFRKGHETVSIHAWGKNALRVRAWVCAQMPAQEGALLPPEPVQPVVEAGTHTAVVRNGNICAVINSLGKIRFLNAEGELLLEEYYRRREGYMNMEADAHLAEIRGQSDFASALDLNAREFSPILGGAYALTMRFESDPEEKLYGMGQYQQPFLNLKGCTLELAHRNSQASVPFLLSSKGYGFLWNNPAIGSVTFARNVTEWHARSTEILDYWICAGDTPSQITSAYASVTGTVPMMPDYAMGFWQCKLRYMSQEELLSVAREYHRLGVPVSVIVVDYFHWPHQGDWCFDPEYWPDPEGMVRELESMGMKLMVSVWPTVDTRSVNYLELSERGLLIRTDRGVPVSMLYEGNTLHFDATNPEARAFIWEKCRENYYKKGIHIFWLDEAEPEYAYYDFDLYRYYLGPNIRIGNLYPRMYAQAFYDGMRSEGQESVINLLRCAWAGSQRYGALVWSGDIDSSFRAMRNQLCAGLNMGIAGIPWWTTDIGGFHGGNIHDPTFHEILLRWFAWGCYCPVMRLHGDRDPQLPPPAPGSFGGGQLGSGAANEIWSYGEKAYSIMRSFIFKREELKPYIRLQMERAHQDGTPVMRPLFYDFPEDPKAWECEDAYMFGDALLVAPVLMPGVSSRPVYLPSGCRWTEEATGRQYDGGQTVDAYAPLEVIPVFRKEMNP